MSFIFRDQTTLKFAIASRFRLLRTYKNLSRKTLSQKSGVSEASLKRFERSGEISLSSLLALSFALEASEAFDDLFSLPKGRSLDEIEAAEDFERKSVNKRGRL